MSSLKSFKRPLVQFQSICLRNKARVSLGQARRATSALSILGQKGPNKTPAIYQLKKSENLKSISRKMSSNQEQKPATDPSG